MNQTRNSLIDIPRIFLITMNTKVINLILANIIFVIYTCYPSSMSLYSLRIRNPNSVCAIPNIDIVGDTGVYSPGTCYDVKNTTLVFGTHKYSSNNQQVYDKLSVNSNKLIVISYTGDSAQIKCSSFPLSDDFLKLF